jgi:hypothetical protein
MTRTEAIEFLKAHQPMPSDRAISDEEGRLFAETLRHFEAQPEEVCIPLFVGSVSGDTGLGMYQQIRFVFQRFPLAMVGPHIRAALRSPDPGVRAWAVDWALDCPWSELLPDLQRICTSSEDEDAHELAHAAMERIRNDVA